MLIFKFSLKKICGHLAWVGKQTKKMKVYSVVWIYLTVWIAFVQPSHERYKCIYSFKFCLGLFPFPGENRINIQIAFVSQAASISQFRVFCILIWREWNVTITSGEAGRSWDVPVPGKGGESVCLFVASQSWLPSSAFHAAAALAPCHVPKSTVWRWEWKEGEGRKGMAGGKERKRDKAKVYELGVVRG